MAMLTLLLLTEITEDDCTEEDWTELDERIDELTDELLGAISLDKLDALDLLLLTEETLLLTEEILEGAAELLLATSPQFFTNVHELSLPGMLCVHQLAL